MSIPLYSVFGNLSNTSFSRSITALEDRRPIVQFYFCDYYIVLEILKTIRQLFSLIIVFVVGNNYFAYL
jgi:hypothetical protein